jgi:RNA polymerase-associated protein
LIQQIEQDPDKKNTVKLKKILRDTVLQSTELFKVKPYFLSDEFSLVDATIAPVLWRLPYYEIDLPPQAQPIIKYASLIFSRPAFRESLSDAEQEMRLI